MPRYDLTGILVQTVFENAYKLRGQYKFDVDSRYFDEAYQTIFHISIASKKGSLLAAINRLQPGTTNLEKFLKPPKATPRRDSSFQLV